MYATQQDLVDRFDITEILNLGWPSKRLKYRGAYIHTDAVETPEEGDAALVDGVLVVYLDSAWSDDAPKLDDALADASATIDSYIDALYALPLATPLPRQLTSIAVDLARYNLYTNAPPESVIERKQDAMKKLEAIAAGRMHLQVAAVTVQHRTQTQIRHNRDAVFSGTDAKGLDGF